MNVDYIHEDLQRFLDSDEFRDYASGVMRSALIAVSRMRVETDDPSIVQMVATWIAHRTCASQLNKDLMNARLTMPSCFTAQDLADSLCERLLVISKEGDNCLFSFPDKERFEHFATYFRSKTLFPRSTAPLFLAEGNFSLGEEESTRIWSSSNGFCVDLLNRSYGAYDPLLSNELQGLVCTFTVREEPSKSALSDGAVGGTGCVRFRITAHCTQRALEKAATEISRAIKSAWNSLATLDLVHVDWTGVRAIRAGDMIQLQMKLSGDQISLIRELSDEAIEKLNSSEFMKFSVTSSGLPPKRSSDWIKNFLRYSLDLFYLSDSKKDTIERRLRNAIRLLIESDHQDAPAIQLSLCFAGIEALVCTKKEGIVDQLARNVATLLQPQSDERRTAISRVKKLYDLRSKVLHGTQVDVEMNAVLDARRLAGGVLMAVVEWRLFAQRIGQEKKQVPDFFDALEEATVSGKRFVGVPDESVAWLPNVEDSK